MASYTSRNWYTSHITVYGYLNWSLYHLPTKNPLALYLGISNMYMHLPTIVGWFSHFCKNEQFRFVHRVVRTSLIISKKFLCFHENCLEYQKKVLKRFQLVLKLPVLTNVRTIDDFQQFSQINYWIYSPQTMRCAMSTQDILQFSTIVCPIFFVQRLGIYHMQGS